MLVSYAAIFYIVAVVEFIICVSLAGFRYGPPTYNPVTITISDLQAVSCGTFQGAHVCSPLHTLANVSVAVLGVLIIAGSILLHPFLPGGRRKDFAIGLLVIAGLATFANAFTPEDVTWIGDLVTAIIAFLGANFGLIQIGRAWSMNPQCRGYAKFSQTLGTIGMAAFILDGFGLGSVIGLGAIEWLIIAPILIWACATGLLIIFGMSPVEKQLPVS